MTKHSIFISLSLSLYVYMCLHFIVCKILIFHIYSLYNTKLNFDINSISCMKFCPSPPPVFYDFSFFLINNPLLHLSCISTYHVQRSCLSMHVTDVLCPGVCCFIHENTLVVSVCGSIGPYGYG